MELPPQGMARDLIPGFLPLHLGWGPNPKESGEKSNMGWKGRREVSGRGGKAASCPPPCAVSVCTGGWGQSQILQPLWRGDSLGRVNLQVIDTDVSGDTDLDAPALPASNRFLWTWGGAWAVGGRCLPSWASEGGSQVPCWARTSNSRGPPAW